MRPPIDLKLLDALMMRHKKLARAVFLAALFAIMAALILLDVSYVNRMPMMPDPPSGRVHWMSLMHGYEIYVTAEEMQFNRLTKNCLIGGFVLVAGTGFWLQRRYFSEEQARETQLRKGLKLKEEIERVRKP